MENGDKNEILVAIAKLGADFKHIQDDIREIRTDLKETNTRLSSYAEKGQAHRMELERRLVRLETEANRYITVRQFVSALLLMSAPVAAVLVDFLIRHLN